MTKQYLCIHNRRGNYEYFLSKHYGKDTKFVGSSYFLRAVDILKQKLGTQVIREMGVILVSDEPDWMKKKLMEPLQKIFDPVLLSSGAYEHMESQGR